MKKDQLIVDFLTNVSGDKRIQLSHICLYVAIYHQWQSLRFEHPVKITRRKLMLLSKIKSFATYRKCILDLEQFGYLRYKLSHNPTGSLIYLPENYFST